MSEIVIDSVPSCDEPEQRGEWVFFPTEANTIAYAGAPGPTFSIRWTRGGFEVRGVLTVRDSVMKGWRVRLEEED